MQITAPIFVMYQNEKLVAFDELFEAELIPVEHLPRVTSVYDATGQPLALTIKTKHALRLGPANEAADQEEFRAVLIEALQAIGDIDVDRLGLSQLVARAVESFRLRKKFEWDDVDWGDVFGTLLLHLPIP